MIKSNSAKSAFHRVFGNAARPTKAPYLDAITRDQATIRVNEAIADALGPVGHNAIEEIRRAMAMLGGAGGIGGMCMEIIDGRGTEEFSEYAVEVWRRFTLWYRINEYLPELRLARDATIRFAQGEKPSAIETALKIRRGHGKAKELIRSGVRDYCEMAGWVRPRNP